MYVLYVAVRSYFFYCSFEIKTNEELGDLYSFFQIFKYWQCRSPRWVTAGTAATADRAVSSEPARG